MTGSRLEQPQFCVDVEPQKRLVTISGELDIDTAPLLQSVICSLVEQPGDLTINLAELLFVDSAGLNEFVRIGVSQHLARHRLTLVGTSPEMRRTFDVGGLTRLFPVVP
jgi:anti-sigma B factor antagonist